MNPYESPSTVSSRAESPTVDSDVSIVWFTIAGLISGTISAVSLAAPPLGLFVPPLAFGIALSLARRCRAGASAALVAGCCGAWFVSLVIGALSMGLEHFPPARGFWSGVVSGAVGSLIVVGVYQAISPASRTLRCIALVGSSGALIAGVCVSTGIQFADHSSPPNPMPHAILFPVWQAGVALSLAISERFGARRA
jgi:hypothetical protein